jgi:stage II sporulation protein D
MRFIILLFFFQICRIPSTQCQEFVRIGLNDFSDSKTLNLHVISGGYRWLDASGMVLDTLNHSIAMVLEGDRWQISNLPSHQHMILQPILPGSKLSIQTAESGYRQMQGLVHFLANSSTRCIVEVPLETYLPGVLAAEAGKGHSPSFYEAQAIVCRTYTVQAMGRHKMEGFDLCSEVHCQVFKGIGTVNDTILSAVMSTRDLILIDQNQKAITAAFHSNCGGHTQGAEAVWQHSLPYLRGVEDSFCLTYPHSHWEQVIEKEAWGNWIRSKSGNTEIPSQWLPRKRESFLMNREDAIRTAQARKAFGLRSSFFIALDEGDSTRIIGRGFGHGVGLCQEGAMGRAKAGHNAWEILSHYFQDVRLSPWQETQK